MKVQPTQYTGRKARIGGICFVNDRMVIFVGYCPECKGKVVMDLDEARSFANIYTTNKKRTSNKFIERLANARRI
jgi:hypothetical protein